MTLITFKSQSKSFDNEDQLASGYFDVPLFTIGQLKTAELNARCNLNSFDSIYYSDLNRSYHRAQIALAKDTPNHT